MGSKRRFQMLEDFWMPQGFQQRPVQPKPETPNVKMQADMMNMTPALYTETPAIDTEKAKCHRDPRTLEYVVIPHTSVYVEKACGTLIEHETKHEHRFDGPVATPTTPPGSYKFRTDNDAWPYMYVSISLFKPRPPAGEYEWDGTNWVPKPPMAGPFGEETLTGKTAKALFLSDVDPAIPSKSPLTKRQIKLLRKKNVCPDCKQKHMCWPSGPSEGALQKYGCANCHAKYNMTPKGTKRI